MVNPAALPFVLPPHKEAPSLQEGGEDDDEFDGGKTEITARAFDYYLKDMANHAGAPDNALGKTAEEAVPNKLIEDFNTDALQPPTQSAFPPSESFEGPAESSLAVDSPAVKPPSGERKSAGFASLLELGNSGERAPAANGASSEFLEELSAGAPLEETAPERTEEVSAPEAVRPAAAAPAAKFSEPEPFHLGSSLADRPPSQDGLPSLKSKGSGKKVAIIGVLAAAAAFAAVYLAKARPWESAPVPPTPIATLPKPVAPSPSPAPVPPPSAQPSKPAAEEPAKPVLAAEAKVAATEKAEPEKKAAESAAKGAEKGAAKASEEPSKGPSQEPSNEKPAAKSEPEPSSKIASKGKAGKAAAAEKAGPADEEIYRLVFRSTPLSAEVLIDGEYYARTPCERRILDPKKAYAITVRKQGYESHERLLGPSDNWVKKGNERILMVNVSLKKASVADIAKPADSAIEKAVKALDPPKAEDTKAAPKPEPAKPASPPEEKPALFKPVPNFDEPAPKKAKE
jgi:hypothetical protein